MLEGTGFTGSRSGVGATCAEVRVTVFTAALAAVPLSRSANNSGDIHQLAGI